MWGPASQCLFPASSYEIELGPASRRLDHFFFLQSDGLKGPILAFLMFFWGDFAFLGSRGRVAPAPFNTFASRLHSHSGGGVPNKSSSPLLLFSSLLLPSYKKCGVKAAVCRLYVSVESFYVSFAQQYLCFLSYILSYLQGVTPCSFATLFFHLGSPRGPRMMPQGPEKGYI